MSLPQEDRSYILKLPNEVLSDILSDVVLPSPHICRPQIRFKVSDSPFYAVRAVCRRFRAVVAELPLWCQPDFDILTLKPYSLTDEGSERIQFLRNLLTDGGIVRTLQKRTHWRIITIEMLETLMNGLPLFRESVLSMQLYLDDEPGYPISAPLTHAMSLLEMCHSLTSLFLAFHGLHSTLNLDDLSQSLPSLETLHIHCMLDLTTGSVALKHLRDLLFQGGDAIDRYGKNTPNVLPIHSALTLQNLTLRRWPLIKGSYNHTALDCLVNLTFLDVEPLNRALCKLLRQFPGCLTTLNTGTYPISWD